MQSVTTNCTTPLFSGVYFCYFKSNKLDNVIAYHVLGLGKKKEKVSKVIQKAVVFFRSTVDSKVYSLSLSALEICLVHKLSPKH